MNRWTYGNIEHLLSSICFYKKKNLFYLQTRFQFRLDQEEFRECLDIMIKKIKNKKNHHKTKHRNFKFILNFENYLIMQSL